MKVKLIITIALVAVVVFMGCTKSDTNNPAAPVTYYLTMQSISDSASYNWNWYINAYGDVDSALYANFTPSQTGHLDAVRIMFGNWDTDTMQMTNVDIKVFAQTGSQPSTLLGSKTISANEITANGQNQYRWTNISFAELNIAVTNGQHFYVAVSPHFTDYTSTSRQAFYVSMCGTSANQNSAIQFNILGRDGTFRALDTSSSPAEGDPAIAAVISY